MEELEKKLREKIKETIKAEDLDLNVLAKDRIKNFAAVISRLLTQEQCQVDVVVGGGNSGLYMLKMTEFAYEYLDVPMPRFVKIPVVRTVKDPTTGKESFFDNSVLIESTKEQLKGLTEVKNILFVDDEIMVGTTAKSCFDVILKAVYGKVENIHCNCVIVAEHHFFEWHHNTPYLSVRFFSFGQFIPGVNNLVSYFLPNELFEEIQELCSFGEATKHNRSMGLVVGGALKADKVAVPYYDYSKENILKEGISDYLIRKESFLRDLKVLVELGISEHKEGERKFKF